MGIVYYGAFDDDGTPIGLFRAVSDDAAQTLDLERLDENGSWVNDPSLIDELQEPEVQMIDAKQAAKVQQALLAQMEPSDDELAQRGDELAADAES